MTKFEKGQRVKVEFEGTVHSVLSGCHGQVTGMYVDSGKGCKHYFYPAHANITLLDPPDWPPQVGDIWEAEGKEYFAAEGWGIIALVPANDERALDVGPFKTLNPTLVRRRGQ